MAKSFIILAIYMIYGAGCKEKVEKELFQHHYVANPLPGPRGLGTGGFSLADFDNDGDLDITISPNATNAPVYLYENRAGTWVNHTIGSGDEMQLGTTVIDVDNDGNIDLVMSRFWLRNPGDSSGLSKKQWQKVFYNGGLEDENHDITTADINMDGVQDIISYSQTTGRGVLRWYDRVIAGNWTYHTIADDVNDLVKDVRGSNGIHGGFAPKGVGDLDGDQFPDVILPRGFYKNPGKGVDTVWRFVQWPFESGVIPNPYGLSCRSWIEDLDADGDNDVVYTDCDGANSKGYYIENLGKGNFRQIELSPLPDSTGSFHSLAVADFDLDGDLDIVSGEQEDPDPGMKPAGLKERGFIWQNIGSIRQPDFILKIFHLGSPGWHEMQAGDVDGDGDMDLVSKIWNNKSNMYHVDYWENLTK